MNNTTAVGAGGTSGAALVLILCELFPEQSSAFWSAAIMLAFSLPAFLVAAVRFYWRLKREADGKETQNDAPETGVEN